MTDKPIRITNKGTYIKIVYVRKAKKKMKDFLDRVNLDDYYIIKSTRIFRIAEKEELLNMVNAGYILYHKDYDIDIINEWLDLLKNFDVLYLSKPLPPRYVLELVKKNKQI